MSQVHTSMSTASTKIKQCVCIKIIGHLEDHTWLLWPRDYKPSPGILAMNDWLIDPFVWLHYVESNDGLIPKDDVLLSKDSQYWSINDVQRYFVGDMHCEKVLFTYQYPNLRMPSALGSHLWKTNTAMKLEPRTYLKELYLSLEATLKVLKMPSRHMTSLENVNIIIFQDDNNAIHNIIIQSNTKIELEELQMDRLIISDQLVKLDQLNFFKRSMFFRSLKNILCLQNRLQLVSFENLCSKRIEGVSLIEQLACFNAQTLKYLFLWRFVLPNENPLLINYSYISGSGQYIPRPDSSLNFLRSLGSLTNLRLLALEYSHLTDEPGDAIISLLPVLKRPHFRLQILCREDQTPGRNDAAMGSGGHMILDTIWRRVTIACPDLYLLMVFFRIRDYDNVRRFLSPSIPLKEVHLQYGIDLIMHQRQDSDLSCFVRHIAFFYSSTLVAVSIHQWRFVVFPLRRVFELMPHLVRFHYIGRVEDDVELRRMLNIISYGVCDKLKHVKIQIQDDKDNRDFWRDAAESLLKEFSDIMELYGINLCISVYKH